MEICEAFVLDAQSQSTAQRRHDRTDMYIGMKIITNLTYPVNMPDPIRKRFGYCQLWPLRPACSQNRPGSYMPDLTPRIRFSSIFSKQGMDHIKQNRLGSDLDGLVRAHLVWKQAGVQESSGPVSGRTQPARYQFPSFTLRFVLPLASRIILCKTSRDPV